MAGYYIRYRVVNPHSGVRWFDGQGNHPLTAKALGVGPLGTVEAVIAHHRDVHSALAKASAVFYLLAAANMAAHRDTGNAHIVREKGDLDWHVALEDQGGDRSGDRSGKRSALSIEFGWVPLASQFAPEGERVGGLFILTGAARLMGNSPHRRW